jgi:hypothetical protein
MLMAACICSAAETIQGMAHMTQDVILSSLVIRAGRYCSFENKADLT